MQVRELEAIDVRKRFDKTLAVDGVSFTVSPGRIFGLLGRNGAGKTTTLRMIAGIFYPDSGEIHCFGAPWSPAVRDRMAYLPEERGLYRKMRVLDQLLFFAEIKGKSAGDALAAAENQLRRFELWDHRLRRVEELSKGNQQKIQLAGVLIADPDILVLDEPMSGLDVVNVILVRDILRELRDRGRTIVLSTHMMAEAQRMCDDICLVHRGRVVLSGSVSGIRASRGRNVVEVEFEGASAFRPGKLAGVESYSVDGHRATIQIRADTDTNALLRELMTYARITRFEVAQPSLEEIFVEEVGEAVTA